MKRLALFAFLGVIMFVIFSMSSVVMAPSNYKRDPQKSTSFAVEIEGVTIGPFTSIEGIGSEIDVIEYKSGDDYNEVSLTGGNAHTGPITLRRILGTSDELWKWYENTKDTLIERKSMSIIFFDHNHNEQLRYNFFECWPSEYYIEPLESSPSNVAYEVIIIQCERMELA